MLSLWESPGPGYNRDIYPRKARANESEQRVQEIVTARGNPDLHTELRVQYHPDQNDVGIGLELTRDVPGLHFIDVLYGDASTQTEIGRILAKRLADDFDSGPIDFVNSDEEAEYMNRLGRAALDAVTGSTTENNSLWAWFDRPAINRLIRLLRKARDISFGRDE